MGGWVVDGHDSLARPPPLATADFRRPRDNGRRMGFVCTESMMAQVSSPGVTRETIILAARLSAHPRAIPTFDLVVRHVSFQHSSTICGMTWHDSCLVVRDVVRVRAAADALRQRRAQQPVAVHRDLAHGALVRLGGDARDRARQPELGVEVEHTPRESERARARESERERERGQESEREGKRERERARERERWQDTNAAGTIVTGRSPVVAWPRVRHNRNGRATSAAARVERAPEG